MTKVIHLGGQTMLKHNSFGAHKELVKSMLYGSNAGGDELSKIYDRGYLDVSRKEVWWFRVVQLLKNA